MSSIRRGPASHRVKASFGALLCVLVAGLVAVPCAVAAQTPFEPNDTLTTASGPLAINQTYTAATETTNDRDYYFFYVTSRSSSQVLVTLRDLGGGPLTTGETSLSLQDAHGSSVTSAITAARDDFANLAVTLPAGKYFLEVQPAKGNYGDNYSITTGGTDGAFDSYEAIAAQCTAATTVVNTAQAALTKAEVKLRKAKNRIVRSRHKPKSVRLAALRAKKKARRKVLAANDALEAATADQKPWCFIPQ